MTRMMKSLLGQPAEEAEKPVARKGPQLYHAVSIVPGHEACQPARALRGQRFLSREAPALPLKGCDCSNCECHYAHHEDRRQGKRRARDLGAAMDAFAEEERRKPSVRGRRKSDG